MKNSLYTVPILVAAITGAVSAQQNVLSDVEKSEGFAQLFTGTLQSFKDNFVDYQKDNPNTSSLASVWQYDATNQAIITRANTGDIRSKLQYGDFDFRMDYRNPGNQGVFYRFNLKYTYAYESGVELAIDNATGLCHTCAGAAYELYAPAKNVYRFFATGQWNSLRVVAIKDSVEHWLNGEKVVGYKYHNADYWAKYNLSKWNSASTMSFKVPRDRNGGYIESGYIGLQGNHNGNWDMRNIRIATKAPYFGPAKTTGVSLAENQVEARLAYALVKDASGSLALTFQDNSVLGATLSSLDGKTVQAGRLADGGRKVSFGAVTKAGMYFLQVRTPAGNVTRKMSIL